MRNKKLNKADLKHLKENKMNTLEEIKQTITKQRELEAIDKELNPRALGREGRAIGRKLNISQHYWHPMPPSHIYVLHHTP